MEETVKHRLLLFIKEKGLSQKRFEEAAHISNGYVNNLKATGIEFTFLLLKPAIAILHKYHGHLPLLSNVKYNQYLKVVAQTAGVDKPITTHWARHTGATMLLNAGVDMETVAKILGHSSTKITRSTYAKLLDDTVAKEMIRAESKLPSASSSL